MRSARLRLDVQEKLRTGKYATTVDFASDVRLVWKNAKTYNQEGSEIYDAAHSLEKEFEGLFAPIPRGPLRSSDTLAKAKEIVKQIRKLPNADPFNEPVDWEGLKLDDYLDVIKQPMDLGTILRWLDAGTHYTSVEAVFQDLELVWRNAMMYNMEARAAGLPWLLSASAGLHCAPASGSPAPGAAQMCGQCRNLTPPGPVRRALCSLARRAGLGGARGCAQAQVARGEALFRSAA